MPTVEIEKRVLAAPEVRAALAKMIAVRIDLTDGNQPGEPWKVDAVPTLLLLDPEGRELKRKIGWIDPAALAAWLGS
jgi:hypothetical protein